MTRATGRTSLHPSACSGGTRSPTPSTLSSCPRPMRTTTWPSSRRPGSTWIAPRRSTGRPRKPLRRRGNEKGSSRRSSMARPPASPAPTPSRWGSEIAGEVSVAGAPPPARDLERCRRNDRLAIAAVACLYLGGAASFVDPDIFHCLSLARESLSAGRLLESDVHAYTPTVAPVVHHEWLHGLVLHAILARGGAPLFLAWKHAIVLAIGISAFLLARRRGAGPGTFAILAPAAILMIWTGITTIGAQMYRLLFTVLLVHFL